MTKLNQESGRSMVEMLGVLAIIGVLSIGGIAGYTMAMNRYRANEILNAASMLGVVAMSQNAGQGVSSGNYTTLVSGAQLPAGATAMSLTDADTISVTLTDADICTTMNNIAGTTSGRVSCNGTTATVELNPTTTTTTTSTSTSSTGG